MVNSEAIWQKIPELQVVHFLRLIAENLGGHGSLLEEHAQCVLL